VGSAVLAAAVRKIGEAVLAGATAATAAQGDGFRPGAPEAMGAGSGTHDLEPRSTEPMTSGRSAGPTGPGGTPGESWRSRRALRRAAAAAGVVVVVVLGRRRRRRGTVG
jgi:hypothetical protein